jgi:SNF2 family DNA or RNA helicase
VKVELRDYQQDLLKKGVEILTKYSIVYYALEMRLGKTFISLFTADHFKPKKVIFVTKKKAIDNIKADFEQTGFTWELVVTNYESMHKLDLDADIIVFDESHRLGAMPMAGLATIAAQKLCGDKKVILLSGTPSPETESQLFHQFAISKYSPFNDYKNFFEWANDYVDVYSQQIFIKNKQGKPIQRNIKKYDKAKKDKIFEVLESYFVRYSQKQAGFKQEIIERIIYIKPSEYQLQICRALKNSQRYDSANGWFVTADSGASMQSKFHQIYSGTVILSDEDELTESGKPKPKKRVILNVDKAKVIKSQFAGKKIAIFYKFEAELHAIKREFDNITDSQFAFRDSNDLTFVGQITSCREGINLATADCLVFYNISFAALDYWQTRNRFQAQDREKPCEMYWIFTKGGIEEKIFEVVKNKKDYTLQYFKKDFLKREQLTIF